MTQSTKLRFAQISLSKVDTVGSGCILVRMSVATTQINRIAAIVRQMCWNFTFKRYAPVAIRSVSSTRRK
jgi:hypothetical protein